jgi:NADP-dependent 3-hydroxy acid dehydrogenase YdfG
VTGAKPTFAGHAALVTGAGGGIGRAIAEALDERGARVALVGRRAKPLQEVDAERAEVVVADLTSDDALRAAADECLRRLGRLDVLVHSNGIHLAGALAEATVDDLDRLYAANVRAPFLLTSLLLPALRASAGQIVFVNSSTGLEPRPGVGLFSASQHALRAIADVLRAEVNPDGIRVLNVYPGRTATARQERIFREEGRAYAPERLLQPADIASVVIEALAAPRTAEVTEIRIRPLLKPKPI